MQMLLSWVLLAGLYQVSLPDWPQFLGPNRDGVYSGPDITEAEPELIWKKNIGEGFSSPVVIGDVLFLYHRIENQERLDAIDVDTGDISWSFKHETNYRDDFGFDEGPRATPVVFGDSIVIFGAQGVLHSIDRETGKKRWRVDTHEMFNVRKGFFGASSSPLVNAGKVLLNVGGSDGAGIVAFSLDTGALVWKSTNDKAGYASPVVKESEGFFFTREGLTVLSIATGEVRFKKRWRSRSLASVNAATPLVNGNLIFLTASYGTGAVLLKIARDGLEEIWSSDDVLSSHYSSVVIYEGTVFGFHGRQEFGPSLRAVDLVTGNIHWSIDRFMSGTVTLVNKRILVIKESGEAILANATKEGFSPIYTKKLLPRVIRSYPAIAAGRLYIRNVDTLAAFDLTN